MRYSEAAAAAPPGSETFSAEDIARLCAGTLSIIFDPGPASPPLEDVAAALDRDHLFIVASRLPPARGERLLRLGQRPVAAAVREAARRRLVGALFWFLVYELAPERWERLSDAEHLPERLVAAIPCDGAFVVDVAAGCGRLSVKLAPRAGRLLAVEPIPSLRQRLAARLGHHGNVIAAAGHRLPLASGAADLVVSCAAFGPDFPVGGEPVLAELERCTRAGGAVVLVGPEAPQWFTERGYQTTIFEAPEPAADPDLVAFFGSLHPPDRLLIKRL